MATLRDVDYILESQKKIDTITFSKKYKANYHKLKEMIRSEVGISATEKILKIIFRAKHESEYIKYYENAKKAGMMR